MYTVKAGYHIAMEDNRTRLCIGEALNAQRNNDLWRLVWSLQVPPKVKNFVWKACNNILPVRYNLHRKGISPSVVCPLSDRAEEVVMHALVLCQAARVSWFARPLIVRSEGLGRSSSASWFSSLMSKLDKHQQAVAAMIAWGV